MGSTSAPGVLQDLAGGLEIFGGARPLLVPPIHAQRGHLLRELPGL